jgi:hypothetical protein
MGKGVSEVKKERCSEENIIAAVKQLEAGRPAKDLAREPGVTVRLAPELTQTVKTLFAVRCKTFDRQNHFNAEW